MHCNWVKQKSFSSALLEAQSCLEAHWVEETASTNDDVKEWVKKADEDIAVALVTDRQTAGRGTRGRRWTAPAASVLLTVGVPLSVSEGDLSGLSPVVGAACAESLWKLNPDVRLKWPNDLWIGNGKAAGILCELVRNRAHRLHAVIGIGVNMCLGKIGVPTTDVPAAAVLVQLPDVRKLEDLRVRTAVCLSLAIERVCRSFSPTLITELQARWPQLDALAGKPAELTLPSGEVLRGQTVGIGDGGELLFVDEFGCTRTYADARIRSLLTNREKQ